MYVADCRRPPIPPTFEECSVRLSAAAIKPAPFNIALYPPPDTAIPMFGRVLGSLAILEMYSDASNPDIFARLRNEVIGAIVLFLRSESHAVSLVERVEADRITGRFEGQSTFPGAYPPVGESGAPR